MSAAVLLLLCLTHHADVRPVAGLLVRALIPAWRTHGICIEVKA
jgi:hypothetical protein